MLGVLFGRLTVRVLVGPLMTPEEFGEVRPTAGLGRKSNGLDSVPTTRTRL